jgi:NDP-sugar pyrophosphorylase family protein
MSMGSRPESVVLMVGGQGRRLLPLTETCPKPLLDIQGKPLLQRTVESLARQGLTKLYFAVHHQAELIQSAFGDGSRYGVEIEYLLEKSRMGTAGNLSSLKEKISRPFIVMNGDLLTALSFDRLLDFHRAMNADATLCVTEQELKLPYGIVAAEAERFIGITEKPVHNLLINAGIYVLNPSCLSSIPENTPFDMPELLEAEKRSGGIVTVYKIDEQWIDIGNVETYRMAQTIALEDTNSSAKTFYRAQNSYSATYL